MNIEELKKNIEINNVSDDMLVFKCTKSRFVAEQYAREISKLHNLILTYVENISSDSMFDFLDDDKLYIFITDIFNGPFDKKNHIVITKETDYNDAILIPDLELWQIVDYARTICSGADENIIDKLVDNNKDIYGLDNELHKLCIFDEKLRKSLSKQFLEEGAYSNLEFVDTFDFINAVQNRSFERISELYSGYEKDPMSFIGLMCKQFRNMVNVYLQKNPTEENTGLKSNQIYAIKKVCQKYSKEKIYSIFKFLISLDEQLKLGKLPTENLFDYVLVKVLSI